MGETTVTTMEWMTTAVGNIFSLVSTTITNITSDSTLSMFFVAGLIGIAVGVLRKIKRV